MINSEKNLISAADFSSLGKEAELFFRKLKVLSLETGEILNSAFDLGKISDALKAEKHVLPAEEKALKQAFDGIKGAVSGISNIMNILQVGADTFVGKLLSGFNATLSIVDSIVAIIKSINEASSGFGILGDIFGGLLSVIPGGGVVKAIAGTGGMVHYSGMPNVNSFRSMNAGRNYNPNISVMVHSEIGKQASYKVLVDGRIYEAKKADR